MQINCLCISYVLFADIFTRFLIAVFLPASPFINFGDFWQPPRLLHHCQRPSHTLPWEIQKYQGSSASKLWENIYIEKNTEKYLLCFCKPEQAEVIVLQDFKWTTESFCWKYLLLLLERKLVNLPSSTQSKIPEMKQGQKLQTQGEKYLNFITENYRKSLLPLALDSSDIKILILQYSQFLQDYNLAKSKSKLKPFLW